MKPEGIDDGAGVSARVTAPPSLPPGDPSSRIPYLHTSKELDDETNLYYFGARYYDPRTSVWVSADPALEEFLPPAPTEDNPKPENNLPGLGGVFNSVNLGVYAFSHMKPLNFIDPDGNKVIVSESGKVLSRTDPSDPSVFLRVGNRDVLVENITEQELDFLVAVVAGEVGGGSPQSQRVQAMLVADVFINRGISFKDSSGFKGKVTGNVLVATVFHKQTSAVLDEEGGNQPFRQSLRERENTRSPGLQARQQGARAQILGRVAGRRKSILPAGILNFGAIGQTGMSKDPLFEVFFTIGGTEFFEDTTLQGAKNEP